MKKQITPSKGFWLNESKLDKLFQSAKEHVKNQKEKEWDTVFPSKEETLAGLKDELYTVSQLETLKFAIFEEDEKHGLMPLLIRLESAKYLLERYLKLESEQTK